MTYKLSLLLILMIAVCSTSCIPSAPPTPTPSATLIPTIVLPTATVVPTRRPTNTPTATPLPPSPTATPFIEIENETAIQYLTSELFGLPGEVVTHTLLITNLSSVTKTYGVYVTVYPSREIYLLGWDYDLRRNEWEEGWRYDASTGKQEYGDSDLGPQKSRKVNIPVRLPQYGTNGMTHTLVIGTRGITSPNPAPQPRFTTVISSPTSIEQISHVDISAKDIAIQGDYAYVATDQDGLHVLDVSDPARPFEVADYSQQGTPQQVAVHKNYVYALFKNHCDDAVKDDSNSCSHGVLGILDVSDPATPIQINSYDLPEYKEMLSYVQHKLRIFGDNAYVTDKSGGLHILDISDPTQLKKINSTDIPAIDFFITDRYLYVVPPNGYIFTLNNDVAKTSYLNILDRLSLAEVGSYHLPETSPAIEVIVINHIAYVHTRRLCSGICTSHYDGWFILDVSNPATPIEMAERSYTPGEARDMALVGDYAYLADGMYGLRILDVSSPDQFPVEVEAFGAGRHRSALDVEISDGYIYLVEDGLSILQYNP